MVLVQWFQDTARLWGRSLAVFIPQNFWLFTLVTLNAIKTAYLEIVTRWWWLVFMIAAFMVATYQGIFALYAVYLWLLSSFILLFVFYLMIRPAVDRKTIRYALGYWPHFLWFCGYLFLVMFSSDLWLISYVGTFQAAWWSVLWYVPYAFFLLIAVVARLPLYVINYVIPISSFAFKQPLFLVLFLYPFTSYFMFFLLDGGGSVINAVKSLYRAFLMQLYTLPFSVVGTLLMYVLYYGLQLCISVPLMWLFGTTSQQVIMPVVGMVSLLLMPIFICFWSNMYIKQIHDNFKIYCDKQS